MNFDYKFFYTKYIIKNIICTNVEVVKFHKIMLTKYLDLFILV